MRAGPHVRILLLAFSLPLSALLAHAGGPLLVGGPASTQPGEPYVWNTGSPIAYRTDGGSLGRLGNSQAVALVQSAFQAWQDVPTASVSYSRAGQISGFTDVAGVTAFNSVLNSCESASQSPIIFDATGSLTSALGIDPAVIGFAGICSLDDNAVRIRSAFALINGAWHDGNLNNGELSATEFEAVLVHEFGHFSGLDHSQVNLECLETCSADHLAGLPTMFPFLVSAEQLSLAPDDLAWISHLYPAATYAGSYGGISGRLLFSDGKSGAPGGNLIARQNDDPNTPENESLRNAVSVVSGFLFTANPGQSVTADYLPCKPGSFCSGEYYGDNSSGSHFGSRDGSLMGYYLLPLTRGHYKVSVEPVYWGFTSGSSVGPYSPPLPLAGPAEGWNLGESAIDDVAARNTLIVEPGETHLDKNIILNGTQPRFDQFEDSDISQLFWNEGLTGPAVEGSTA